MSSYLYQYSVGTLIFAIGLIYAWRRGDVGLTGKKLRNLCICIVGLLCFAGLQGALQFSHMDTADPVPYEGLPRTDQHMTGTTLDHIVVIGYFSVIVAIGVYFGRRQKTTDEFFFGGRRFSWWLVSFSFIATLIGSYSFVKYSRVAFEHGLSSSQTYLNDWFWMPLFIFGWLPIVYFARITSVPEYFERRFDSRVRLCATIILLTYLIGYVGVNFFTMGKMINALVGIDIFWAAVIVAAISACYVTIGGQTSVIMTDLFQGIMLLFTGLLVLFLGIRYLGGFDAFWTHLPRGHRAAFSNFNDNPSFSTVGIFWQDAIANSAMFYFVHQGILMRFMAAKSIGDARRAAVVVPVILMPLAACVVAGGGWIGRAFVHAGVLPSDIPADKAFYVTTQFLSQPGMFGLIVAALTAALMSTVDTLITAVSAILVNDVYHRHIRQQASEQQLLRVARISAASVTLFGVLLVPVFSQFSSIYAAHGAFTAAVTPPLVVTLMCSVFWRRFTRTAALATMIGGMAAIVLSFFIPELIQPFAHGMPIGQAGDGLLGGLKQYKFMRACYGICVSSALAIIVTACTKPTPPEKQRGLVWQ